ncbi:hypothetical protein FYJ27_02910 [Anaerosalibacter bizertensis]|uniref:CHRD domain-containing protein n=1 Tax=Anaerosalibacter bizertensis TaxID=932217 RepID=A0A844FFB1_9FIRM|nr:hypothetical protein [Anaerosalibacter bizertensis]MSS42684.1 hypothetical protein [Anaerosalibacter bizertensis]
MKKKVISLFTSVIIITIFLAPIAFANSASFKFTMNRKYVNGAKTGHTHSMTAGRMSISGKLIVNSLDLGCNSRANTVTISVFKKQSGRDKYVGSTSATPKSQSLGSTTSFSKAFGKQTGGTYYIVAGKAEDDGWNLKGRGTLTTR